MGIDEVNTGGSGEVVVEPTLDDEILKRRKLTQVQSKLGGLMYELSFGLNARVQLQTEETVFGVKMFKLTTYMPTPGGKVFTSVDIFTEDDLNNMGDHRVMADAILAKIKRENNLGVKK